MPDPSPLAQVKVLVFDLMGTCTDWKSHILRSLEEHAAGHPSLASRDWSAFAQDWRMGFFRLVEKLASKHQNPSTSDDDKENTLMSVGSVYRQVLDELCERDQISEWSERDKVEINDSWGKMTAWEDVVSGLNQLRKDYFIVALSNGSTRFLAEVCRNADLRFDVLYTSDLVGHFKPHPNTYKTVIKSLGFDPSEYAMVASHAYDLEAAQKCGMRAIYTHRSTEDVGVDLSKYGFDLVVEDKGAFHNVKNELEKLRMRG